MPLRTLTREEVRSVDARAISELGMPGLVLMENAGRGAAERLLQCGVTGPVVVCAGKGNNGGDGFVIARHLSNHGVVVRVLCFCEPECLVPPQDPHAHVSDFLTNYGILHAAGVQIQVFSPGRWEPAELDAALSDAEWIVDALLGTGAQGEVRPPLAAAIERINASGRKVLAVDLPSGLDCDTGRPQGMCVRADRTVTFVARKAGFDVPGSERWTGEIDVVEIGVPLEWLERTFGQATSEVHGSKVE